MWSSTNKSQRAKALLKEVRGYKYAMQQRERSHVRAGQCLLNIRKLLRAKSEREFIRYIEKHCRCKERFSYYLMDYAEIAAAFVKQGLPVPESERKSRLITHAFREDPKGTVRRWRALSAKASPTAKAIKQAFRPGQEVAPVQLCQDEGAAAQAKQLREEAENAQGEEKKMLIAAARGFERRAYGRALDEEPVEVEEEDKVGDRDYWPSPRHVAPDIHGVEKLQGLIWECAAGDWRLVQEFNKIKGISAVGSDLHIRAQDGGEATNWDFLTHETPPDWEHVKKLSGFDRISNIITNPPYSLKDEFVEHALQIATEKVCMLLPVEFLHGAARYRNQLFTRKDFRLARVWVYPRRLSADTHHLPPNFPQAWFVWAKNHEGPPTVGWFPL